jgi:hypothetical protein
MFVCNRVVESSIFFARKGVLIFWDNYTLFPRKEGWVIY